MSVTFDFHELDEYANDILDLAINQFPEETNKFLKDEGNKLRKIAKDKVKTSVKKDTGEYLKHLRRSKIFKEGGKGYGVSVYNSAKHGHLIEDGHRLVKGGELGKGGRVIGFVPGKHVIENSGKEFEGEFVQDANKFVDEILDKL